MFQVYTVIIPSRAWRTIFYLLILANSKCIHSWDLAVASDGDIKLLSLEGNIELKSLEKNVTGLYALAFDPNNERFFFSITEHQDFNIYQYSLADDVISPLIMGVKAEEVPGIAFDSAKEILYWTDGTGSTIRKRSLKAGESNETEVVITLKNQFPSGIAISHCHRALFWANSNHESASINRAEFDGSKHMEIVTSDIKIPHGITVDEAYGKIYWTDDRPGIYYRIERCNVDGSNREIVLQRTHQAPFGLALVGSTLLWSDTVSRKIFSISTDITFPNRTEVKLEPYLVFSYDSNLKPYGLAANRNATISCEPLKQLRTIGTHIEDEVTEGEEIVDFCLNSGQLRNGECRCKPGFSGQHCEVDSCFNHCLFGGRCYIDRLGYPDCLCDPGYEGRRCEKDVCDDYCLSGGRCFVEAGQPACKCPEGASGQRCEVTAILTLHPIRDDISIIAALGAVGGVLLIVVIVLSWRVIVLRRRPRVKKRYIVNKPRRGQTPMTSRPPAVDQCEITIENCCNMNICETPCFEPNIRTSKSSSSMKKTEDRRNLLKNMEEPSVSD